MPRCRKVELTHSSLNEDRKLLNQLLYILHIICNDKECCFMLHRRPNNKFCIEGGVREEDHTKIDKEKLQECLTLLFAHIKKLSKRLVDGDRGYMTTTFEDRQNKKFQIEVVFSYEDNPNACSVEFTEIVEHIAAGQI